MTVSPDLRPALFEYRWLLDRGYAEAAALKLVGDRHQLPRDERMLLFRGVCSSEAAAARSSLLLPRKPRGRSGEAIYVDGYNQALTVMFYIQGRPLFVGTDGYTRDSGGSHGNIPDEALFERAAAVLCRALAARKPRRAALYLDAPVAKSAAHAALFRALLAAEGVEAEVELEKSADAPLKALAESREEAVIATSDSAIVDAVAGASARGAAGVCRVRLLDAARDAIELAFGEVAVLDLGALLAAEGAARGAASEGGLVAEAED